MKLSKILKLSGLALVLGLILAVESGCVVAPAGGAGCVWVPGHWGWRGYWVAGHYNC